MYIGPDDVLVTMQLSFEKGTETDRAAAIIAKLEQQVQERYPVIRKLFIEVEKAGAT
jgi:divalent metal cation (Fe/Co/Zn/Cd) transporter